MNKAAIENDCESSATCDTNSLVAATSLTSEQVQNYLLQHPEFFVSHPDVLTKVMVPDARKGSVSLIELQNTQLRQKVSQLSLKLNQLIEIAKENQHLCEVFAELNMQLLRAKNLQEIESILQRVLTKQLGLSCALILPFAGDQAIPELQQRLFTEKRFKQSNFFFGRLGDNEKQLVFNKKSAESSALVLLGNKQERIAMLAIGSSDAAHFTPDMDTLLLEQLKTLLEAVIPDFIQSNNAG